MKFVFTCLGALFIFAGCHTSAIEPVKKEILGSWVLQPVEEGKELVWTFDSDGFVTATLDGERSLFRTALMDTVSRLEYTVQNMVTNHYVWIDYLTPLNDAARPFQEMKRWLVIYSRKDELFLSSEDFQRRKGGFQYHFLKQE